MHDKRVDVNAKHMMFRRKFIEVLTEASVRMNSKDLISREKSRSMGVHKGRKATLICSSAGSSCFASDPDLI
jgi:hypothetical protein